ncbi:unnamed protein product [Danaus chrysippus]|uniref:(African queen) hypothetical protein n=1 Tax=Danaus chrysippus TaxID=151541 RepID=A0A8J2QRE4_9NEOP|nr:unnamed protein product [Danaus chrysippus]
MYTGRQGPSEAIEAGVPLEPVPGLPAALPPPPAFLHPFPPQMPPPPNRPNDFFNLHHYGGPRAWAWPPPGPPPSAPLHYPSQDPSRLGHAHSATPQT